MRGSLEEELFEGDVRPYPRVEVSFTEEPFAPDFARWKRSLPCEVIERCFPELQVARGLLDRHPFFLAILVRSSLPYSIV